jgi:phospholipid transport system substrate-binding protein
MIARFPLILLVWLMLAAPAKAVTPLDYTRGILEQARTIVSGTQTHDEKVAALSALFAKFLDTDAMAHDALGQHWSSFTPAQQKQFLPLFRELIQKAYVQDLLLFNNPDFEFVGQQPIGGGAIVDTKIITPRDKFDIRYKLIPAGDRWMVSAITVEGVNLTDNYGNQFNRVLSRTTPDDLIALMRRKFGNPSEATKT